MILRRLLLGLLFVLFLVSADLMVFIVPPSSAPARSDVVVVLGPPQNNDRLPEALSLVRRYPGSQLLLSVTDARTDCPKWRVKLHYPSLQCFRPEPFTTQGEARVASAYAHAHHYSSMTVVTTPDQIVRAGVRFMRCFHGTLRLTWAHSPLSDRFHMLVYQNEAMVKALFVNRSC